MCSIVSMSCSDNNDIHKDEFISKRIVLSFEGNMDNIAQRAGFSVYTDNRMSFLSIHEGDTINIQNGIYQSIREDMYSKQYEFRYDSKYIMTDLILNVSYLKFVDTEPTEFDNLYVEVNGYVGNRLVKTEKRTMKAFRFSTDSTSEYNQRPLPDDYILTFIL